MITVEDLSVSFGQGEARRQVVKNVSFSVAKGETLGIVGESGCGKSTVLRSLAGLDRHWERNNRWMVNQRSTQRSE